MNRLLSDIAKNVGMGVPLIRRRKRQTPYNPATNQAAYIEHVFAGHRATIEKKRPIAGARVLEIGPGANLAVAAMFLKHGAREATCIDAEQLLADVPDLYAELGLEEFAPMVRYLPDCPVERARFADGSFDVVFSTATLERVADPGTAIENIARMLAPGGVTTHQIDLRDSSGQADPLGFLRYSDRVWWAATSNRPSTPNRWRAHEFAGAFTIAGLEVFESRATQTTTVTEKMRASFAARFRRMPLGSLATLGLFIGAWNPFDAAL